MNYEARFVTDHRLVHKNLKLATTRYSELRPGLATRFDLA